MTSRIRVGITGVSGYGGRELLRLCVGHPTFEVTYVGGETTAGQRVDGLDPALLGRKEGALIVQAFDPGQLGDIDLLFASLPTGGSREPLAKVASHIQIVDVGGDHRFVEGWDYGLTELPGARGAIARSSRVANPGCYPAATLLALAPLVASGLIEPTGIVVDAKSGVSGAGRGGRSEFGFAETNDDVMPYGLEKHVHVPEMCEALTRVQSGRVTVPSQSTAARVTIAFTPHLIPMTRGIVSTTYGRPAGSPSIDAIFSAADAMYANEPFVKVVRPMNGRGPHSRWTTGSNLCFVTYSVNQVTGHIVAIGVIDNLGKGAAGQAIQNANLMTGQVETAGLMGLPLSP